MRTLFRIKLFLIVFVVFFLFAACTYKDEKQEKQEVQPFELSIEEKTAAAVISPYELSERELHLLRGSGVDTNDFLAFIVNWNGQEAKPLQARVDVYENGQFKQAIFENAILTTDNPSEEHLLTFAKHDNSNSALETEWIVSYQPGSSFMSVYNTNPEMTGWSLQKAEREYVIGQETQYILGVLVGGRGGNVKSDFSLTEDGKLSPKTLENDFVYVFSVEIME